MKIMTLNTHSWLEEAPLEKLQQIAEAIIASDFELIALQEINQSITAATVTPDDYFCPTAEQQPIKADNFAYLLVEKLNSLGHSYYWSWTYNHIGYDRFDEGVALLAKAPLNSQSLLVSTTADPTDYHTRRCLIAQTELAGQTFSVVSCHFSWWGGPDNGFAAEWQRLVAELRSLQGPYLLLGDFNNPADEAGYQLILRSPLALQDAFTAAAQISGEFTVEQAIDGWRNTDTREKRRIDYIFTSLNCPIKSYEVIFNGQRFPVVSDHFGLAVTLGKS